MTNFQELNQEIQKAQAQYEEKAKDLDQAQKLKEEAEIALIRADSTYKRLRLEVSVIKSRADSLREQSYNLRREAGIK